MQEQEEQASTWDESVEESSEWIGQGSELSNLKAGVHHAKSSIDEPALSCTVDIQQASTVVSCQAEAPRRNEDDEFSQTKRCVL
ncbi:hypothetical protein HJFPF1_07790 [Paramyrothecium foliicola]|nr:hypothetical protein HJFPF1_07790 [Paramyrothecium foliicola]